jgi:nitroreductase
MNILDAINSRASAIKLGDPAPSRVQLTTILEAGARAPDHGKLGPWRFIVLEKEARSILGEAMVAALKDRVHDVTDAQMDMERAKVNRAPTIVVVAAKTVDKGDKVPQIEQVFAVAAAAQNVFLAAHELGFGVMWRTGHAAYDLGVKQALSLNPQDQIVGFLYIGSTLTSGNVRRPNIEGRITWL